MRRKWKVNDPAELEKIAGEIAGLLKNSRLFIFSGPLGVGKTTFIKYFCKVLKVNDEVCSPTFNIVNEYNAENGLKIYHFDFYRINSINEVYDLGYEEYFYSGSYCFIEWPEKITPLLPEDAVSIEMNVKDGIREIELNTEWMNK
jgi:tRNA threonylcarbamoyladenosine biosynthesis protein TsaE